VCVVVLVILVNHQTVKGEVTYSEWQHGCWMHGMVVLWSKMIERACRQAAAATAVLVLSR